MTETRKPKGDIEHALASFDAFASFDACPTHHVPARSQMLRSFYGSWAAGDRQDDREHSSISDWADVADRLTAESRFTGIFPAALL